MESSSPRLITIPLSHFCEKARWALDRVGVEYREEPHIPLLHRLHTARVGCRSVPVLVVGSEVVPDSHAIVQWAAAQATDARLYPAEEVLRTRVVEIEHYADRELGPHVRRWAYSHLLGHPHLLLPCFARGARRSERLIAPLVIRAAQPLIRSGYRVDPASGRASLARAESALAQIAGWLADGRRYLVGERFTAADLTVASLAAPLVCAPQYGGVMPPFDALPAAMCADIERLRTHPGGKFVLELYARERVRETPWAAMNAE
jgi:glutathione S-transferase